MLRSALLNGSIISIQFIADWREGWLAATKAVMVLFLKLKITQSLPYLNAPFHLRIVCCGRVKRLDYA